MQVSLFSVRDAGWERNSSAGLLLSISNGVAEPLIQGVTQDLRERTRRDEEREAGASAASAPTRSADVINDAERNAEFSSRAFRRQVARDGATEQFQQDRQEFRQALTAARGREAPAASTRPLDADAQTAGKTQLKPGTEPQPGKAPVQDSGDSIKIAPGATRPATTRAAEASRAPLPKPAGAPAATNAGSGTALNPVGSRTGGAFTVQTSAAVARSTSSASARVVKPGSAGGGSGPAAMHSTRAAFKPGALAAARGAAARPAQKAAFDANIERIVRFVHSRVGQGRSRTILRLDPPELGSLRLQMDLRGAALTLRVDTSTRLAHRLLTENLNKLRHGLEASGIHLERVEVRPPMLAHESAEPDTSRQADAHDDPRRESGQADAEHPQEHGKDSHPADASEGASRGSEAEPTAEPLVNVIA